MKIAGLLKTSFSDYTNKVSSVIFLAGCNFKCHFCHNSSLVNKDIIGISREEVVSFLKKRKGIIDGVVISGGEPTIHDDLVDLIREIKELGYDIKLDTNGTNKDVVKYLVENKLIDYIAMDIKNGPSKYNLITNSDVNINDIKDTIDYIISSGIDYEFRTTLVKEYFSLESIKEMGKLIEGSKRLYLQKFVDNENCLAKGLNEVNKKEALEYASILSNFVKEVHLRGY